MSEIGVGLVGYKFMGRAHSNAYRQVAHIFDVDPVPVMRAICGRDAEATAQAAAKLGWESYETDFHTLVNRDDIGLVDVSTPGYTHRDVVMAALEAGKHVLCEKPLANTLEEAAEMLAAARKAGTITMVNFNYRRVPAVAFVKQLIDEGRLGTIRHWRAVYLQDWLVNEKTPLAWRLKKELAGSGALGDIGAHIVDLSQYLIGDVTQVVGTLDTIVKQRPVEAQNSGGSGLSWEAGSEMGEVTVDDSTTFLAKFENGATGTFEATRMAAGRRNFNSFEINGSLGSVVFNLERLNEIQIYFREDESGLQGFRTINVTEAVHPYTGAWWPSGHIIGWEHTHTHVVKDLLDGIRTGNQPYPSFEDGFKNQAVLEAVIRSAETGSWESPAPVPT